MKVAYFTALRQLELRDEPRPGPVPPGHVLVRIDRVGVCGSDVHYYSHGRIGKLAVRYPATLGHECAGTVIELGHDVSQLRPGQRVAIDPAFSCGTCDQCRAGREHTCRQLQFMGSPGEAPGAVAEFSLLPAQNCFPIPDHLTLDAAVLAEPLSIGLHAVHLAAPRAGQKFAILGAGPIGLSVLLCFKALQPCTAYVTDLLAPRLAAARQCGADWTGNPREADIAAAVAPLEPHGLDLVFECSGDPACVDQAVQLLGPGGTLILVGIPPIERVSVDAHAMRRKELTIRNVRRQCACVAPVVELIAQGRIDPSPMLTHRFPLADIQQAFDLVADYRDGVIKALIDVGEGQHSSAERM